MEVLLTAPPVKKGDVSPRMNVLGFADRLSISAGGKQMPKAFAKGDLDAFFFAVHECDLTSYGHTSACHCFHGRLE